MAVSRTTNGKTDVLDPPPELEPVSNDALSDILLDMPYEVDFTLRGNTSMLFHRWSVESVAEKAAAPKNSRTKKTDDVESYVWRNDDKHICLPGEYVRQSVIVSAKSKADPRRPRASSFELYKAGLASMTEIAPLLVDGRPTMAFPYIDQRRVTVQRAGITRSRPAFAKGWEAKFRFQVLTPEYISFEDLLMLLTAAGRFVGVGDFRPTYGRFDVTNFELVRF